MKWQLLVKFREKESLNSLIPIYYRFVKMNQGENLRKNSNGIYSASKNDQQKNVDIKDTELITDTIYVKLKYICGITSANILFIHEVFFEAIKEGIIFFRNDAGEIVAFFLMDVINEVTCVNKR